MTVAEEPRDAARGLSRRDVLRRGATAGAVLAWTAPAVMSMSGTAFAQTNGSPKPTPSVSPTVQGTKTTRPGVLPRTGTGIDVGETVALGATLVAAGTALEVVRRRRSAADADADAEPKHA